MPQYFVYRYWSIHPKGVHVVHLGDCPFHEANRVFETMVREADDHALFTLVNFRGHELKRLVPGSPLRSPLEARVSRPKCLIGKFNYRIFLPSTA